MNNQRSKRRKLAKYLAGTRILLIDSSILMLPVAGKRRRINIEEALYQASEGAMLAILDATLEELKTLKEKARGKKKLAADFALELVKRMKLPIIKVDDVDPTIKEKVEKVKSQLRGWEVHDEILAQVAEKLDAIVATTDMDLVRKLRSRGVTVMYLRAGKWIVIE